MMRIESIKPRNERELKDIHNEIIGCVCDILQIPIGNYSVLIIDVEADNNGSRREICTSPIYHYSDTGNEVNVTTRNSEYHFVRI